MKYKMAKYGWAKKLSVVLVGLSAINIGISKTFSYDILNNIFGTSMLATLLYVVIGVSGIYTLYHYFWN